MCGRFTQRADSKRVAKEFKVAEVPAVDVRYNIAPTQEVLTVYEREDGREATFFKWGLVPSWAKDASMGARLINARSETVAEKPAFRQAFKRRRCIQKEVQPGTLIHDSTIFDGVDERQIANALQLVMKSTAEYSFQYICCLNSDSVPYRDLPAGFDLQQYVRRVLTDATDDGGLLGVRF